MSHGILKWVFFAGLVVATLIRSARGRRYRQLKVATRCGESPVVWLLMYLWGVTQVVAVLYVFTPWLGFADYHLPVWVGWIGAPIYVAAVWLLWRSHVDLGRHWSPTVEIMEEHALVTDGVFRSIRHPMYAAHLLWVVAQPLLLHNWIAGLPALAIFVPVYLLRVPREEEMMLEHFSDEYRKYMNRTGRVLPRLRRYPSE